MIAVTLSQANIIYHQSRPNKMIVFLNDVVTSFFVIETFGFFNNTNSTSSERCEEMLWGIYRISKDVRLREHIKLYSRMLSLSPSCKTSQVMFSVYRILLKLKPD